MPGDYVRCNAPTRAKSERVFHQPWIGERILVQVASIVAAIVADGIPLNPPPQRGVVGRVGCPDTPKRGEDCEQVDCECVGSHGGSPVVIVRVQFQPAPLVAQV